MSRPWRCKPVRPGELIGGAVKPREWASQPHCVDVDWVSEAAAYPRVRQAVRHNTDERQCGLMSVHAPYPQYNNTFGMNNFTCV